MTKQEYMDYHAASVSKMSDITKAKNSDYTGVDSSPFANFERVEAMGITDTMRGFLVRMTDKLSRLTSFAQKGHYSVSDESFEDTCLDLANYAILLAAYHKSKPKQIVPKDDTIVSNTSTVVPAPDARALTPKYDAKRELASYLTKQGAK